MSEIEFFPIADVGLTGRYEISKCGKVRRLFKCRGRKFHGLLAHVTHEDGYIDVSLTQHSGVRKRYKLHRLLALAFIQNPCRKPFVNHKDGNKGNNALENLEWCTAAENSQHAVEMGLLVTKRGEDNALSKLTNEVVLEIFNAYGTNVEIGLKYGVYSRNVAFIKSGRTWSHITGKVYQRKRRPQFEIISIKKDVVSGMGIDGLMKKYSLSRDRARQYIFRRAKRILA